MKEAAMIRGWWHRQANDTKKLFFVVGMFLGMMHTFFVVLSLVIWQWGPLFPLLLIDVVLGLVIGLIWFSERMFPDK